MKEIGKFVGRLVWDFSESFHIPLGRFAPTVFGWMIGVKGGPVGADESETQT